MQAHPYQERWQQLNNELQQIRGDYQYDPKDDNAYYREGLTYSEMYGISRAKEYLIKAVQSYGKAIKIKPRAMYVADRSKAYTQLDLPQKAVQDFQLMAQLTDAKGIDSIYAKHVQKSLAKLDKIKSTISDLEARGDLPADFLQSYKELVGITEGLVLKVGIHDEKIATLFQANESMSRNMKKMEQKLNKVLQQAQQGKLTVKQLNQKVLQLRQEVVSLQNKMIKFVSKDELDQMAASLELRIGQTEKKVEFCNAKIVIVQGQLDQQEVRIAHIDEQLLKCNIYKKNQLKQRFSKLRSNDPKLYEYANVFYWTFSNYVLAYRVISTGLVEGKQDDNKLVSLAKKVTGLFSDTISSIPGIGSVIPLIQQGLNALYDGYKGEKMARKVQKINQIVSKNALEQDINLGILLAAIQISIYRQELIKADTKEEKKMKVYQIYLQARSWFQQKLDKIMTKMTGIQSIYESKVAKTALTDVLLLLGYLIKSSDIIIVKNDKDVFHQELINQFKKGIMDDQLIQLKKKQKQKQPWKWPWQK